MSVRNGRVSAEGNKSVPTVCAHVIPFGLRRLGEDNTLEVCLWDMLLIDHARHKLLTFSGLV